MPKWAQVGQFEDAEQWLGEATWNRRTAGCDGNETEIQANTIGAAHGGSDGGGGRNVSPEHLL